MNHEVLYLEEKDLFGVFVCGVSYMESLCYATYVVATVKLPSVLRFACERERRDLSHPNKFRDRINSESKAKRLFDALDQLDASPEWRMWRDYRNTHAHRTAPPRLVRATVGDVTAQANVLQFPTTWSTPALAADAAHFDRLLAALARHAEAVMTAGTALAQV
jgi:hypothetical protein